MRVNTTTTRKISNPGEDFMYTLNSSSILCDVIFKFFVWLVFDFWAVVFFKEFVLLIDELSPFVGVVSDPNPDPVFGCMAEEFEVWFVCAGSDGLWSSGWSLVVSFSFSSVLIKVDSDIKSCSDTKDIS